LTEISAAGWVQVGRIDRKEIIEEEVHALFNMVDTDKSGFLTKKVNICLLTLFLKAHIFQKSNHVP
jgi:hypothetical protein